MTKRQFNKDLLKKHIKLMKQTYQIPDVQTIWEHGLSVALFYKKIIIDLENIKKGKPEVYNLFIPESLKSNANFFLDNIKLSHSIMQKYLIFHDIGKPSCIEKDSYG